MRRQLKRPVVQLTSLLDLLFVMIFVSLLQTKSPSATVPEKTPSEPAPVAKAQPRPKAKPTPVKEEPKMVPITAVFHFYATPRSPGVPTGTYSMSGTYNRESGSIELGGTAWINRPAGYDMVPLKGRINGDETFTGRIEFQECQEFTLTRGTRSPSSDIAGNWEGSYVCAQGETGLTLTIQ